MSFQRESNPYANKRSPAQREQDYGTIASLYLRGESQAAIGQRLGVSGRQVGHDLKKIQQRWRDASIRDFDERKAEELARIDHLEREYWSAWTDSKRIRKVFRTRRRKSEDAELEFKESSIEREDQSGDARFLQGVERCIDTRCKILGLYAPTKIDLNELDSLLARELARIAGADQAPASGAPEEDANPEVTIN